jgi:two-component system, NarL family, sensor kinase
VTQEVAALAVQDVERPVAAAQVDGELRPEHQAVGPLAGRPPGGALARQNRELAILNSIATALNGSADLDAALSAVLSRVADLLDLGTGWVLLMDEATHQPYLAAEPERMEGPCLCLDTFQKGDLADAANFNVVACSRLKGLTNGAGGLRFHASIPLHAGNQKLA